MLNDYVASGGPMFGVFVTTALAAIVILYMSWTLLVGFRELTADEISMLAFVWVLIRMGIIILLGGWILGLFVL